MSTTNFNTSNSTYRKLIGNGLTYRIPRFQRDYSWGENEWDDLWQDILGTVREDGEAAHYMGYLVLQSTDEKTFDVIDGQQRLTTLSIIVLAVLRQLQALIDEGRDVDRTQRRLDNLRQTYVGYLDPVTLVARSKLMLNRNNDSYYQTYLVPLVKNPPQRRIKASEHSLRKAFEWHSKQIRDYIKDRADPGMELAQLVDQMSDRLFFTVITVTDELNAYKVFETLNSRGVRLSATDLLKNYLFSVLYRDGRPEDELKRLDDRWEVIIGRLGSESFPDFLRAHWISRHSFVRQTDLFKIIRAKIPGARNVFELLEGLEEDTDTYLALVSPDGSAWSQDCKKYTQTLRTFSVRQPFPLLMAAKRLLSDTDFTSLLRAIVAISFRYNVIGNLQAGDQERAYHAEAERIARGDHLELRPILEGLRAIYPSDNVFHAAFSQKSIGSAQSRNRQVIRYMLCEIERRQTGADLDHLGDMLSIEHICPLNPDGGWAAFTDEQVDEFASRIGNMTLLKASENKALGHAEYADKKPVYAASAYQITQNIAAENEDWTPDRIENRQKQLSKLATSIWRIDQLG